MKRLIRQPHRADAVPVAVVRGAGEGELGEAELPDVAQPLEERMVDDRALAGAHLDGTVDRVPDLHRAQASTPLRAETAA